VRTFAALRINVGLFADLNVTQLERACLTGSCRQLGKEVLGEKIADADHIVLS